MKPFFASKTFWGLMMGVIAPLATQAIGVDVTTGVQIVHDAVNGTQTHYTTVQWLQLAGQAIGYYLTIHGTLSKTRKPLQFNNF